MSDLFTLISIGCSLNWWNWGRGELGIIGDKYSVELLELGELWGIRWILLWGLDLIWGLIGCERGTNVDRDTWDIRITWPLLKGLKYKLLVVGKGREALLVWLMHYNIFTLWQLLISMR